MNKINEKVEKIETKNQISNTDQLLVIIEY